MGAAAGADPFIPRGESPPHHVTLVRAVLIDTYDRVDNPARKGLPDTGSCGSLPEGFMAGFADFDAVSIAGLMLSLLGKPAIPVLTCISGLSKNSRAGLWAHLVLSRELLYRLIVRRRVSRSTHRYLWTCLEEILELIELFRFEDWERFLRCHYPTTAWKERSTWTRQGMALKLRRLGVNLNGTHVWYNAKATERQRRHILMNAVKTLAKKQQRVRCRAAVHRT